MNRMKKLLASCFVLVFASVLFAQSQTLSDPNPETVVYSIEIGGTKHSMIVDETATMKEKQITAVLLLKRLTCVTQ